jgi:hypothetical protein
MNTRVSENGVRHLSGLRRLRTLDVRETEVTPAGLARLREALPWCYSIHGPSEPEKKR